MSINTKSPLRQEGAAVCCGQTAQIMQKAAFAGCSGGSARSLLEAQYRSAAVHDDNLAGNGTIAV